VTEPRACIRTERRMRTQALEVTKMGNCQNAMMMIMSGRRSAIRPLRIAALGEWSGSDIRHLSSIIRSKTLDPRLSLPRRASKTDAAALSVAACAARGREEKGEGGSFGSRSERGRWDARTERKLERDVAFRSDTSTYPSCLHPDVAASQLSLLPHRQLIDLPPIRQTAGAKPVRCRGERSTANIIAYVT